MAIKVQTNTPLLRPPNDYCPEGSEHWFILTDGLDAGKTLFYYDHLIGDGEPKATVVFVHGNPENSYTYRKIRDALLASNQPVRLIAMDHIGFGLSDQATFEMVDMHHSANLLQLIRRLNLTDVTLAVHDWGGPIGIGAFVQDPSRVKNLMVMNTTVFPMPSEGFTYRNYPISWFPWCHTPKFIPDGLWGGMAAYLVSNGEPQGTLKLLAYASKYMLLHFWKMIPKDSPEYVWSESLRSKANAKSSKRNVLQTPVWGHGYSYDDPSHGQQDNHSYYAHIQATLPEAWGPNAQAIRACGYFGQWDPCGKSSVIAQWHEALPQMIDSTYAFSDIGHFVEEYKGPEIANAILEMNDLPPTSHHQEPMNLDRV